MQKRNKEQPGVGGRSNKQQMTAQKDKGRQKSNLGKLDELDVQRGQNGEKGNTINPQNLRDAKEASH